MAKSIAPKPKQKSQTRAKTQLSSSTFTWRDLRLIVLVIAAGLAVWAGVAYFQYKRSVSKEQAEFSQAKVDLDNLYQDIVAKVGVPTEHKAVQSCAYTNSELAPGYLYCHLDHYLIFNIPDQSTDLKITSNEIQQIIQNTETGVISITDLDHTKGNLQAARYSKKSGFSCSVDYWKLNGVLPYKTYKFAPSNKNGLFVSIDCNKKAKKSYFPDSTTTTGSPLY